MKARFTALIETDALERIMADPAQHEDEMAGYGLDDFRKTFADENEFRSYTVEISVQNLNDYAVQVVNLEMDTAKQGQNGVWFAALTETDPLGLPAGYTGDEALYSYVIADALLSKEEVLQRLGEMGISCVYMQGSETPDEDAQIDPSLLYTSDILYEG